MLTKKQKELLLFLHERIQETGIAPSFDEMKDALDLKSKSGIHRLISALVERGFIRRLAHRARAIEVVRLPDDVANDLRAVRPREKGFRPSVIEGDLGHRQSVGGEGAGSEAATELKIVGRIAAGTPIEALQNELDTIRVPNELLASGDHYVLEVRGDSMKDAGILDGDLALINRGDSAANGDIVVALVDDEEATLKRLRKKGESSVALEAANPAYETMIFGADRVKIQGRLVGLIRRY